MRLASDTLKYGVNGASLVELTDRSNNGLEASYNEMMEAYKIGYQDTEHLLALRQTMSAIFESWRNDSPFGHKAAEDFLKQRYPVSMNTLRLIPQLNRLLYLQQLTTTRAARRPDEAVYLQMNRLMTENLKTEILTYEDLRQYHDYTLEERHAALITIITKFKQVLNDSRLMQEQRPEFFGLSTTTASTNCSMSSSLRPKPNWSRWSKKSSFCFLPRPRAPTKGRNRRINACSGPSTRKHLSAHCALRSRAGPWISSTWSTQGAGNPLPATANTLGNAAG